MLRARRRGVAVRLTIGLLSGLTWACDDHPKTLQPGASSSAPVARAPVVEALKPATHLLEIGERAPSFSVLAHTGLMATPEHFFPKPVALLFCPSVQNSGCSAALLALRDSWLQLRPHLSMAIAALGDDRLVLREYAYAEQLPFLLGSDADQALARAFGVGLAGASQAQLFLIEPGMKIAARFVDPGGQAAQRLRDVLPQQ